jgi:hypothetical protein
LLGSRTARLGLVTAALATALASACRSPSHSAPAPSASVAPSAPAPLTSPSAVPEPLGAGAVLQRRLAGLEVFVDAEPPRPMVVPAEVRRVLVELKDALLESTDRLLPSTLAQTEPGAALGKALANEGYLCSDQRMEQTALDVSVRALPKHRERWGVTLCVLLNPGSDCVLAVYERREGELRRSLVIRSDLYDSIEGALQALTWTAAPPDERDHYYVLEAHTHPWPTSNFRKFWYRALAPSAEPETPIVLSSAHDSGRWTSGFRLEAELDRFSVTFDSASNDGPAFEKPNTQTWVKRGQRFVRR